MSGRLFSVRGLLGCAAAMFLATAMQAASVSFNYTLADDATTSAGVYRPDDTLVRTLWNNELRPAGAAVGTWDGTDDNGQRVPAGSYRVKVIAHDVTYNWEGFIGNTSTNQTGSTTLRIFGHLRDMAVTSADMYATTGYNEKRALWVRMSVSDPNAVTANGVADFARSSSLAATDGNTVYFSINSLNTTYHPALPSFITAVTASTGAAHVFSAGITAPRTGTQGYLFSAADFTDGADNAPTGLAVQKTGNYLFVARRGLDRINVLNKTTGAAVGSFAVTEPGRIAATVDGDLWVICTESGSRVLRRYDVDTSGVATITTAVVTGLADPVAVAVSPDNSTVSIADAGGSQQVKAYANVTSGSPSSSWTLGLAGGYSSTNGPDVSDAKFCFPSYGTFLTYKNDGSFWLGDAGNERYQHFSTTRALEDRIAYISANYTATVCGGQPTRIFARGWLEYDVDYSQPAQTGWTLVKNWSAGLSSGYHDSTRPGFHAVMELSNGRVYAVAPNSSGSSRMILELPASGPARETGVTFSDKTLHEDGVLRWRIQGANTSTVYEQAITGFDGSGNPVLGSQGTAATLPRSAIDPEGNGFTGYNGRRFPVTSSGVMITSNTSGATWHYYLGGVNAAGTDWLWKASPSGTYFDTKGTIGDCIYPASTQFVSGRNILFCCHGEGYQGGQANKFLHYWDNGLLIGIFGADGFGNPLNSYVAGVTGNALSSCLISHGGDLYAWVNDEWGTGMHRWKIANIDSITELAPINVTLHPAGGAGEGLTGEYFTGTAFDTLAGVRNDTAVNFTWSGAPFAALPSDNFSVRWSGLIEPAYSEDYTFYTQTDGGVRLWVDGVKIIDNWTPHSSTQDTSSPVSLTAGQLHRVIMEYHDTTGTAVAQLKWSSASQGKQIIPMACLHPSDTQASNFGGADLGRFLSDPLGTTGSNIVTTAAAIDLGGAPDAGPESLYQNQRKGAFTHTFMDLKPYANYTLRFHVAETVSAKFSTGARVFSATINRVSDIYPSIDPYDMAGAGNKAATRDVLVTADNAGVIDVKFASNTNTQMAGLEVGLAADQTTPGHAIVGRGAGLKGVYHDGLNFDTQKAARFDPEINFAWDTGSPAPAVGSTNYTVRWTGRVLTYQAGTYTFSVNATAGARLWVNNTLLLDYWSTTGNHAATISLDASTLYELKLEYKNTTGSSKIDLKWKLPGGAVFGVIPQTQLYPPAVAGDTVILDNGAGSGVTFTGAWTASSSVVGYHGSNYHHDGNSGKGTKSVTYAPTLPSAGAYDVYLMFAAGSNRATNVPVTVAHAAGGSTAVIDQEINNGLWVLVGSYDFVAGTSGTVTIGNAGTNGHVIADAVKFVKQ